MAQKLPVPRKSLAAFYASHPKYAKSHPKQIKQNPKTYRAALALIAKRKKAAGDSPDLFTAPMGTTQATKYADTLAGAQYDPAIRASQYLSDKQIPDWYQAYQNDLHNIQQRQAASTATATGQIQNFANSSSQVDQTQRDQMTQEMQQSAAQRGATVDPKIALLAQQASASRRAGTDTQGALVAGQGATQASFLLDKERISGGDKISKLSEQARVRQGLLTQRGAEKSKQLGTIRENERRNLLERAAFSLNQQKAADSTALAVAKIKSTAASQAANRATTRRGQDLAHRDRERNSAISEYKAHHPKTTGGGADADAKAKAKFNKKFNTDFNRAWTLMGAYDKKYVRKNRAKIMAVLIGKQGLNDAAARAAYNAYVK